MDALQSIANGLAQDAFIVIDALDECPQPERRKLLNCISQLRKECLSLHILATSRREPDIDIKLNQLSAVAVDIEDHLKNDIKMFVDVALDTNLNLCRWGEEIKSQVREKLTAVEETYVRCLYEKNRTHAKRL